jgi:hypothetical protein
MAEKARNEEEQRHAKAVNPIHKAAAEGRRSSEPHHHHAATEQQGMIQDAQRHGRSAHAIESEESPRSFIPAWGSLSTIGALINVFVHFVVLQVFVKTAGSIHKGAFRQPAAEFRG